jgi:DNA (cytosine-5)-methyltransferase 1
MTEPQDGLNIMSLFSGGGGLEIAACNSARIASIFSSDANAVFLSTLDKNFPKHYPDVSHTCLVEDASNLSGEELVSELGVKPEIIMGGPPCDDYTSFGLRRGFDGDKGPLIFEFLRIVNEVKPRCFIFENVPNLARQFKQVFAKFLNEANEIGYFHKHKLLSACDFGAPTIRSRLFVIGWIDPEENERYSFPTPTHADPKELPLFALHDRNLNPYCLVSDVLKGLPDVKTSEAEAYLNHVGRTHRPQTVEHIKTVPPGKKVSKSFRYRAPWDGLAHSLTAGVDNSTKSHLHPIYHREMSVREYARLQMFPDTWDFSGTHHNGIKQVANSVPIPLGEAIFSSVFKIIAEKNEMSQLSKNNALDVD